MQQVASAAPAAQEDALLADFRDPPRSARPRTWWHWLNGNVTKDGIAKDLAWMESVGLGGVQSFDASLTTPQIVEERLVYMSPGWRDAFRFAVAEAERHGLEFAIAASPGWSETGGPWVPPEDGMKKLVWGETILPGGRRFSGRLVPAPVATGPFQDAALHDALPMVEGGGHADRQADGRVAVLAVPLAAPRLPSPAFALADGTRVEASPLTDASLESAIDLPLSAERTGALHIEYPGAVTLRSARMHFPGLARPFRGVPVLPVLEAYEGGRWREVAHFPVTEVATTMGFDPVTAQRFRVRILDNAAEGVGSLDKPAPGAESFDIFALGELPSIRFAELTLSAEPRLDHVEQKAGFGTLLDYTEVMSADSGAAARDLSDVVDLTDRVGADGLLDWTPPAGSEWRVYSFGWSLTGKTNHPAPPEATGLEVDKLDAAAVRRYLETYLGMYRDTVGGKLIGERGIRAILTDSIEAGSTNWTPGMEAEFAARRGYALRPWLPALAGEVIGSEEATEGFLYDYRRTLAELLAEAHYGTVATVAHEHGLKVYGEALENGRPMLGDDLAMRRHADVPMAAMWTWWRDSDPRWSLLGDMKGAASVAHIYGQNLVAAESMTSANAPWAFAPRDLKRVIDFEFAHGINLPVIHTSVHVPVEDREPGLSLMIFGQYFNRNETWAGMARPWIDYIARSSTLLQHGTYAADVAWFVGEEAPLTAQYLEGVPEGLPRRHGFDYVNADMLSEALRAENGALVSQGGTRYRLLHLGTEAPVMTLPTLRRVADLARQGVHVAGLKPISSPSLGDDKAEFDQLADEMWALPNVQRTGDVEAALARIGVAPDFSINGAAADADILFLHRESEEADIYFVNNRANAPQQVEARFRVTGRAPELWDAMTGEARPLSFRRAGEVTIVPLDLGPEDAKFVVFRQASEAGSRDVPLATLSEAGRITGPWAVAFEEGRGAPTSIAMPALQPLDQHPDPGVRYFSGVATYATSFTLPAGVQPGEELWLDLGRVGDVAEVFVNGERAGITWFAPDRVEIGRLVRSGENQLEVRVANLWVNRLIGDKQEGAEPVTFTAAPTYRADATLRPSGLMGPVTLRTRD